jgi:hypothetical protein
VQARQTFFNKKFNFCFLAFLAFYDSNQNMVQRPCFQVYGGSTKFLNFVICRNCPTYEYGELKSVDENMVNSSPRNSKPSIE